MEAFLWGLNRLLLATGNEGQCIYIYNVSRHGNNCKTIHLDMSFDRFESICIRSTFVFVPLSSLPRPGPTVLCCSRSRMAYVHG
jgi:hypothetical protein